MRKLAAALAALFASGCAGLPQAARPVAGFELERYLGVWHEAARLDHRFERGLTGVTAEYSMRPDGGVRVVNRGYSAAQGRWKKAEGRAYFKGDRTTGALKVSFFRPFYGGYNILELDKKDYSWALVSGPNLSYLWILSRSPELPAEIREKLVTRARELGFPVEALIFPGPAPAGAPPAP